MAETIYIHIVESDENVVAICNGEPFDISTVEGSGLVQLCPECEELASEMLEEELEEMDYDVPNDAD